MQFVENYLTTKLIEKQNTYFSNDSFKNFQNISFFFIILQEDKV